MLEKLRFRWATSCVEHRSHSLRCRNARMTPGASLRARVFTAGRRSIGGPPRGFAPAANGGLGACHRGDVLSVSSTEQGKEEASPQDEGVDPPCALRHDAAPEMWVCIRGRSFNAQALFVEARATTTGLRMTVRGAGFVFASIIPSTISPARSPSCELC